MRPIMAKAGSRPGLSQTVRTATASTAARMACCGWRDLMSCRPLILSERATKSKDASEGTQGDCCSATESVQAICRSKQSDSAKQIRSTIPSDQSDQIQPPLDCRYLNAFTTRTIGYSDPGLHDFVIFDLDKPCLEGLGLPVQACPSLQ